ncbi:MAG TPA: hypothetical protein VFC17_09065 [Candidatus Limnocylindrales bacterium]|jgi:hypothetical protein|nr:hypothetical protein [Candidatus Limnocylindrales bacterium]
MQNIDSTITRHPFLKGMKPEHLEKRHRNPSAKTPSLRKILAVTGAGDARYIC